LRMSTPASCRTHRTPKRERWGGGPWSHMGGGEHSHQMQRHFIMPHTSILIFFSEILKLQHHCSNFSPDIVMSLNECSIMIKGHVNWHRPMYLLYRADFWLTVAVISSIELYILSKTFSLCFGERVADSWCQLHGTSTQQPFLSNPLTLTRGGFFFLTLSL
jgi:hypothetical protein